MNEDNGLRELGRKNDWSGESLRRYSTVSFLFAKD